MAIWMDMTNSLHTWKGGVVGIVRAELGNDAGIIGAALLKRAI